MTDVRIIVRAADRTREAEVVLPGSKTGGEVIQAAVENWSLPGDAEYALVNTRTAQPIQTAESLDGQGVNDGDVLVVQSTSATSPQQTSSIRWTDKSDPAPTVAAISRVIVVCPNCKADLHLPAGRSALVTCPFCSKSISSTA